MKLHESTIAFFANNAMFTKSFLYLLREKKEVFYRSVLTSRDAGVFLICLKNTG